MSDAKPKECQACNGTGNCWDCGGTGRSEDNHDDDGTCCACDGTGTCQDCEGDGFEVPTTDDAQKQQDAIKTLDRLL